MITTLFKLSLKIVLVLAAGLTMQSSAYSQVRFNYFGQNFTETDGDFFTTEDRITGTILFDQIGDSEAAEFDLSVVRAGEALFSISSDSIGAPGFTLFANEFEWDAMTDEITKFDLLMAHNVTGQSGEEQIGISDIGDVALYDFTNSTESAAANFSEGESIAVPEPGCTLMLSCGLGLLLTIRRRSK